MTDFDFSGLPEGYVARVVESSSYAKHCQWLILDDEDNLFTRGTNHSMTATTSYLVQELGRELASLSRDARNYEDNLRAFEI